MVESDFIHATIAKQTVNAFARLQTIHDVGVEAPHSMFRSPGEVVGESR